MYPLQYRTRDRTARWILLVTLVWGVSVVYPVLLYRYHGFQRLLWFFLHVVPTVTLVVLLVTCFRIVTSSRVTTQSDISIPKIRRERAATDCDRSKVRQILIFFSTHLDISIVLNVTLLTLKSRDFGWFFFMIFFKSFRVSLHPSSVKLKHNY